jgi:ABC-type lipoprotein export system ATPase subunit
VNPPVLSLRDVFCVHRTPEGDAAALQGATLEAQAGELICVLGPSGAGKSTLLRVIAGLQTPSAGDVLVLGRDIGRLRPRLRAQLRHQLFGFLGQSAEAALSPDLRVQDCVALPLSLRGVERRDRRARVAELLERVGLAGRGRAPPAELSGGERQRVAFCVAIAHRPRLLLADEPTGELDADSARAVRELIADVTRGTGATTILVSHDAASATEADRTLVIRDGRVAEHVHPAQRTLVVAPDGWVRLPPELLAQASIAGRARVAGDAEGLVVSRAHDGATHGPRVRSPPTEASGSEPAWPPATVQLRSVVRSRGRGAGRRGVLDGLTHEIAPRRMTTLTGRSGSGKTTLLRLIAGIDSPEAGELLIDGQEIAGWGPEARARLRRQRIGYLPQEPSPIPFLSAEENVVLALQLRGWAAHDARERAAVVLARVGLADRARQRVARLSAGESQRVALARALAGARGLLIVDEPTSRLDQANAMAVADLLAEAAGVDGQTVICATHDPEVIARAGAVLSLG